MGCEHRFKTKMKRAGLRILVQCRKCGVVKQADPNMPRKVVDLLVAQEEKANR